jgi:hypothetical protein
LADPAHNFVSVCHNGLAVFANLADGSSSILLFILPFITSIVRSFISSLGLSCVVIVSVYRRIVLVLVLLLGFSCYSSVTVFVLFVFAIRFCIEDPSKLSLSNVIGEGRL